MSSSDEIDNLKYGTVPYSNILFKDYLNVPYNIPGEPNYYGEKSQYSNYVIGEEVFLERIPEDPSWIVQDENPYGISNEEYVRYEVDSTGTVEKFTKLKLRYIEGTQAYEYVTKPPESDNSINLLSDSLQFNYKSYEKGVVPYDYKLFINDDEKAKTNDVLLWLFNYKSGYVVFNCDYDTFERNVKSQNITFTFVRYRGKKGVYNLNVFNEISANEAYYTTSNLIIGKEANDFSNNIILDISGDTRIIGNLTISGNIQSSSDVAFSSNANFGSDVTISGDTTLNGSVDILDNKITFNNNNKDKLSKNKQFNNSASIEIVRGKDKNPFELVHDICFNNDSAKHNYLKVGITDDYRRVATIEDTPTHLRVPFWTNNQYDISKNYVLNTTNSPIKIRNDSDGSFNVEIENTLYVKKNFILDGSFIINGGVTNLHTQEVSISDNTLYLNRGNNDIPEQLETGLILERTISNEPFKIVYGGNNERFQKEEDDGTPIDNDILLIGLSGDTHRVATIEDKPLQNGIAVWDRKHPVDGDDERDNSGHYLVTQEHTVRIGVENRIRKYNKTDNKYSYKKDVPEEGYDNYQEYKGEIYTNYNPSSKEDLFPVIDTDKNENKIQSGLMQLFNKFVDQPPSYKYPSDRDVSSNTTNSITINWEQGFKQLKLSFISDNYIPHVDKIRIDLRVLDNADFGDDDNKKWLQNVVELDHNVDDPEYDYSYNFDLNVTLSGDHLVNNDGTEVDSPVPKPDITILKDRTYEARVYGVNNAGHTTYNYLEFTNLSIKDAGPPSEPKLLNFSTDGVNKLDFTVRVENPQKFDNGVEGEETVAIPKLKQYVIKYGPTSTKRYNGFTGISSEEIDFSFSDIIPENNVPGISFNIIINNTTDNPHYYLTDYDICFIQVNNQQDEDNNNYTTISGDKLNPLIPTNSKTLTTGLNKSVIFNPLLDDTDFSNIVIKDNNGSTRSEPKSYYTSSSEPVSERNDNIVINIGDSPISGKTLYTNNKTSKFYLNDTDGMYGADISGVENIAQVQFYYKTISGDEETETIDASIIYHGFGFNDPNDYDGSYDILTTTDNGVFNINDIYVTNVSSRTDDEDDKFKGYGLKGTFKFGFNDNIINNGEDDVFKPSTTNTYKVGYRGTKYMNVDDVDRVGLSGNEITFVVDNLLGSPNVTVRDINAVVVESNVLKGIPSANKIDLNFTVDISNYAGYLLPEKIADIKVVNYSDNEISSNTVSYTDVTFEQNVDNSDKTFTETYSISNKNFDGSGDTILGEDISVNDGIEIEAHNLYENVTVKEDYSFSKLSYIPDIPENRRHNNSVFTNMFIINVEDTDELYKSIEDNEENDLSSNDYRNNTLIYYDGKWKAPGPTADKTPYIDWTEYNEGDIINDNIKDYSIFNNSGDKINFDGEDITYKWYFKKIKYMEDDETQDISFMIEDGDEFLLEYKKTFDDPYDTYNAKVHYDDSNILTFISLKNISADKDENDSYNSNINKIYTPFYKAYTKRGDGYSSNYSNNISSINSALISDKYGLFKSRLINDVLLLPITPPNEPVEAYILIGVPNINNSFSIYDVVIKRS